MLCLAHHRDSVSGLTTSVRCHMSWEYFEYASEFLGSNSIASIVASFERTLIELDGIISKKRFGCSPTQQHVHQHAQTISSPAAPSNQQTSTRTPILKNRRVCDEAPTFPARHSESLWKPGTIFYTTETLSYQPVRSKYLASPPEIASSSPHP
jgi:hypothetical protein